MLDKEEKVAAGQAMFGSKKSCDERQNVKRTCEYCDKDTGEEVKEYLIGEKGGGTAMQLHANCAKKAQKEYMQYVREDR